MSKFDELIEGLGEELAMEIFPSQNNVISLLIEKSVKMQIETDRHQEHLTIATFVYELPPGRFRERVLKEALKANFAGDLLPGILSFAGKENCLLLYEKLPVDFYTVEALIARIKKLYERTGKWKEALDGGHAAPHEDIGVKRMSSSKGRMFGV